MKKTYQEVGASAMEVDEDLMDATKDRSQGGPLPSFFSRGDNERSGSVSMDAAVAPPLPSSSHPLTSPTEGHAGSCALRNDIEPIQTPSSEHTSPLTNTSGSAGTGAGQQVSTIAPLPPPAQQQKRRIQPQLM
jgi:hypothetical protein